MKLVSANGVPQIQFHHSYRDRSWLGLAFGILIFIFLMFLISFRPGKEAPILMAFPLALALLLLFLLLRRLWHLLSRENWLLRVADEGLYINLRSPYNRHLPRPHPTLLFIPKEEIAAVCKTRQTRELPGHRGGSKDVVSYVDIYLNHEDTSALREILRAERRLKAERGPKHHDYRVRVIDPPGVRLVWEWIKPGEATALRQLAKYFPVAPDQRIQYAKWERLNEQQKVGLIAELWEEGHVTTAIQLARYDQPMPLSKAKTYVESLGRGDDD